MAAALAWCRCTLRVMACSPSPHPLPALLPAQLPALLPALLPAPQCALWRETAMAEISRRRGSVAHGDFLPHGSSLRLRALQARGMSPDALLQLLWQGPLRQQVQARLGLRVALLADQCWARWQFAPGSAPLGHYPHGWHQDGALHADFLATAPPDRLLRLLTCWITLMPCGASAPGLELLRQPLPGLLAPAALSEAQVALHYRASDLWCPVMATGDALLFGGDTLHRSHLSPAMTAQRLSLELRFVQADDRSPRLRSERRIALD